MNSVSGSTDGCWCASGRGSTFPVRCAKLGRTAAAAVADQVRDALSAAGYTVDEAATDSDLDDLFDGFALDQKEFLAQWPRK
jgi:hypothetical protein